MQATYPGGKPWCHQCSHSSCFPPAVHSSAPTLLPRHARLLYTTVQRRGTVGGVMQRLQLQQLHMAARQGAAHIESTSRCIPMPGRSHDLCHLSPPHCSGACGSGLLAMLQEDIMARRSKQLACCQYSYTCTGRAGHLGVVACGLGPHQAAETHHRLLQQTRPCLIYTVSGRHAAGCSARPCMP